MYTYVCRHIYICIYVTCCLLPVDLLPIPGIGEKSTLLISSDLAYGETGATIPQPRWVAAAEGPCAFG